MNKSTTIASTDENASFQQVKTNGINSQVGCTFSKHVVISCITAVRAIHFITVDVMWQRGSSLQPMWHELPHTFCFKSAFSSGQTILLNDRSDRSKPLRSIIDRKVNLRSIICRLFIIVKWIGLLLWKQYIIITVRLGIWDNSHLL